MPRAGRKRIRRRSDAPEWSSPWVFVLAASGAAIGLKNVWQFPFLAGEYGGAAFIVVYVLCLALIALPLLIAEVTLGRLGRRSPVGSMGALAERARRDRRWGHLGWVGMGAGLLILSYLSVIAGWLMAYVVRVAAGALEDLTADGVRNVFAAFVGDPERQLLWHSLFLLATLAAAARGVRGGLEPAAKYAVPALLAILAGTLVYAAAVGDLARAASELLYPDFTRLNRFGVLAALGHAFFSLGVGAGAMLVYGAYLKGAASVPRLAFAVTGIDLAVGLVAGLAVLALLFGGGLEPVARSELLFQALPLALDELPGGRAVGTAIFLSLLLAAWLSAIALLEPWIVRLGEIWGWGRTPAALACTGVIWLLGAVVALSFNYWRFSFRFMDTLKTLGAFDLLQILTSSVLLPAGAALMALYTGWLIKPELLRESFDVPSPCAFAAWLWSVRVLAPALILIVALQADRLFL